MNKFNVLIALVAVLGASVGQANRLPNRMKFKPNSIVKETNAAIQVSDDSGILIRFVKPIGENCYNMIKDTVESREAGNDDSFYATTSGGMDYYTANGVRYRYYNVSIYWCKAVNE